MRVLHVSAYYAPAYLYGGPPRSIHALCRALASQGTDVQVFTTDANGGGVLPASVTGQGEFEGVRVRYFPRTWPASPIGSRALASALRCGIASYDLVHVHGVWNRVAWAAAREAARAGVPYVLSPRGMLEPAARAHHAWRKHASWALADRRVVHGASLLHATAESERQTLRSLGAPAPIVLIPNGIAIEPPLPGERRGRSILFVGRIHPIKRLDLLVDAFTAVRERRPDVRLVIAGPDEAGLQPELTARAGAHAVAIEWAGEVDERRRRELLSQAALAVTCSDSESFGMSVLEAMADAVPVVVTRSCPWAAVERHGAGLWVDQHAAAMADAIDRVLADPAAARAMGERGRALAGSAYGWDAVARSFLSGYQSVVAARPAAAGVA